MNRHRPGKGGRPRLRPEVALQCLCLEGWVKTVRHSNVVFPDSGADGLRRNRLKNTKFTGLAVGGTKGLCLSKTSPEDCKLVISEPAIGASSDAVLFPDDGHARHASIGGKPNLVQWDVIRQTVSEIPEGSEILAAMDADDPSRQLAEAVYRALQRILRSDSPFTKQEPSGFTNWNDQLRASKTPFLVGAHTREAPPA